MAETILRTDALSKKYGNNLVLDTVELEVKKGECHAVVGENGAGKTTLMNILGGIITPSDGTFTFYGKTYEKVEPRQSIDIGISIIHQDFALVPTLTVKENIFLSQLKKGLFGVIKNYFSLDTKARDILKRLGEEDNIDVNEIVGSLSTSKQQIIEIAKALAEDPKLLIMDEPTTSLTKSEVNNLFRIINTIKGEGISVIYVSHILEEVFEISDRISVLRDGKYIGTRSPGECEIPDIITMMVGREIEIYESKEQAQLKDRETVLSVQHLTVKGLIEDISFDLKKGEILGFAGLVGSGRSEVAKAIFGSYKSITGEIYIEGELRKISNPREAMKLGIGLLPEDRRWQGFIPSMNVLQNLTLASIRELSRFGITNRKKEEELSDKFQRYLRIKTESLTSPIMSLSGGNQQKVVLAKWLATNSKILIVDEPTQGIDVGSKSEIHRILKNQAKEGLSVILISSELPEILNLSDRIVVMRQGTKAGELTIQEADQEKIMYLATVGLSEKVHEIQTQ